MTLVITKFCSGAFAARSWLSLTIHTERLELKFCFFLYEILTNTILYASFGGSGLGDKCIVGPSTLFL